MAKEIHTITLSSSSDVSNFDDRVGLLRKKVAHGAGGGAGAAVAVAITGLQLPANYYAAAVPSQDATVWISARSQTGFTVNIAPRLAATTLASGSIDLILTY